MAQQKPKRTSTANQSVDINGLVLDVFNIVDDIDENQKNNKLPIIQSEPSEERKTNESPLPSSSSQRELVSLPLSQHIANSEQKIQNHHHHGGEPTLDRTATMTSSTNTIPTTIGSTRKEYKIKRRINALETDRESNRELLSSIVHDDVRAIRCRIFRFLLVGIMILSYFGYELSKYLDSAHNKYSTSELTKISELEVPYMVFQAVSSQITPYFEYIYLSSTNEFIYFTDMNWNIFYFEGNESFNDEYQTQTYINNFTYNENTDEWTLIEIHKTPNSSSASSSNYTYNAILTSIIIPPKDTKITLTDSLYLGIIGVTNQVNSTNGISDKTEYVDSFANGLSYGIYWLADSREQMINVAIDNPIDYMLERFGNNSQYVFSGQLSLIYIDSFETIDNTQNGNNGNEEYYLCRIGASYIDYDNSVTDQYCGLYAYVGDDDDDNLNNSTFDYDDDNFFDDYICVSPSFWTGFYFMPNPSGIKTTITISTLRDIFDVLSSVGGVFSPLLTATGILIIYFIYGIELGCCKMRGFAPSAGFGDYIFEKKLDVYLAERGLIIVNPNGGGTKRASILNTVM